MNKFMVVVVCIAGAMFLSCGVVGCSIVGTLDREAALRVQSEAQLDVNKANYDKMWKVIKQRTQITKASTETQKELVESLIQGRASNFVKIITESNPESAFDRSQFDSLANSIEAQRTEFFMEQKKLIDVTRENRAMFEKTWSGFVLGIAGREPVGKPTVVTSTQTKSVFDGAEASGIDDDTNLEL